MVTEKKRAKKKGHSRQYSSDSVTAITFCQVLLWGIGLKDTSPEAGACWSRNHLFVVPRKVSCGGGVTYYHIKQILAFFVYPFSTIWERSAMITDMQEHLRKRNACQTRQIGKRYNMEMYSISH